MSKTAYASQPFNHKNLITFLDSTGRSLFGEHIQDLDTEKTIAVKNPAVVHAVPQQNGTMALQLLPAFFREFLGEKDANIIFNFPLLTIALSDPDTVFDFKVYAQYEGMFKSPDSVPTPAAHAVKAAPTLPAGKKVSMFDE